jgi:ABC-type glycerol-3-phosphate transport system substrate-binding protein
MVVVSSIEQKLLIASAGKNPPDLAGIYSYMTPSYADKGALTELTARARQAGLDRSRYVGRYYDLAVHRGKVWGLPTTPASVALHWNKRLFREVGLDPEKPPETLEQLDEMAEKLTKWEVTCPAAKSRCRLATCPTCRRRKSVYCRSASCRRSRRGGPTAGASCSAAS